MPRLFGGRRRRRQDRDDSDAQHLDLPPEDDAEVSDEDAQLGAYGYDGVPDQDFEPFVPVSAAGYEQYGDDDSEEPEPRRRRLTLPRFRLPRLGIRRARMPRVGLRVEVNVQVLLAVIVLVGGGIFGMLLTRGMLRESVEDWWPLGVMVAALLWMLVSLARRQVAGFLGAWIVAGVGLSALMDRQSIAPADDTILGIVLVAVGLGIAFRGFLLRQQSGGM